MKFNFDSLLFEEQAIDASKLAFACSDGDITWKEFEEEVNHMLSLFKEAGLVKGHPVIIYGHKEKLFPVTITACLSYGVPYIPIDTIMPIERVQAICRISGSQVIVNCTGKPIDIDIGIIIGQDKKSQRKRNVEFNKAIYTHSSGSLAYIMFTSGSTGEPKGVIIPVQAVRSFINWFIRDFKATKDSVFMNQAPFSFDISLVEILGTLSLGATAVLNDYATTKDEVRFINRIKHYGCTYWNSTPSFAYVYLTSPHFNTGNLPAFKTFLFMGEELKSSLVKRLNNAFASARIYNAYGPTEATVVTTFIEITNEILNKYESSIPIGYPKPDGEILIENETGNSETEGEIIIVGDHVASGYLNRPEATAEKFFEYQTKRAYRTGDFGCKKDNIVFYNGRRDDQVKLNGYRIEIGDINQQLENIDFVSEAITLPLKAGNQVKKIISFVRLKDHSAANKEELKSKSIQILKNKLPEYMVPSDIMFIDKFPVNTNHKIDSKKLIEIYTSY